MAPPMHAGTACLLLLLAAAVGTASAQAAIPSAAECQARVTRLGGADSLLSRLSACQSGASSSCCAASNGLLGAGGDLGLCLCTQQGLQATLDQVANNALARAVGVTAASVQQTLNACGVPNVARSGSCPSGGAAAPATTAAAAQQPATAAAAPAAAATTPTPTAAAAVAAKPATTTVATVRPTLLGGKGAGHPLLLGGKGSAPLARLGAGGGLLRSSAATPSTVTLSVGQTPRPRLAGLLGGRRLLAA